MHYLHKNAIPVSRESNQSKSKTPPTGMHPDKQVVLLVPVKVMTVYNLTVSMDYKDTMGIEGKQTFIIQFQYCEY